MCMCIYTPKYVRVSLLHLVFLIVPHESTYLFVFIHLVRANVSWFSLGGPLGLQLLLFCVPVDISELEFNFSLLQWRANHNIGPWSCSYLVPVACLLV